MITVNQLIEILQKLRDEADYGEHEVLGDFGMLYINRDTPNNLDEGDFVHIDLDNGNVSNI